MQEWGLQCKIRPMKVVYEKIQLPEDFPFDVFEQDLAPFHSMGEIMHFHDCFELSFAIEGSCTYELEDRSYDIEAGDLVLLNNTEPHRMYTGRSGMHQTVIVFDPALVTDGCPGAYNYDYIRAFSERTANFSNKICSADPMASGIRETIEEIRLEFGTKQVGWQLMIKARLLSLLTILYRYYLSSKTLSDNSRKLMRLRPALSLIDRDPSSVQLDIEHMAELIHVSKQHFCYLFKQSTGQTFTSYLNRARVNKCIDMLHKTDHKITQIAYDCGFRNMSHFSKTFRETTGKTAAQVRADGWAQAPP
ncbi:MAG: AraC family transcriptional regulator [Eubacteriales bacterium]|nr:AraC family transcriptional regulator [Eubacteriales bacterium]